MPAADEEVAEALEEGVNLQCGWGPKEILTENGKVTGVVFKKCLSVKDYDGRFNPTFDEDDTITVPCENVYLSIGQSIEWGNLLDGTKVELGRGNGIVADPLTYQTAEPDIFAGGDVYTGPKFAIDAIAAAKTISSWEAMTAVPDRFPAWTLRSTATPPSVTRSFRLPKNR